MSGLGHNRDAAMGAYVPYSAKGQAALDAVNDSIEQQETARRAQDAAAAKVRSNALDDNYRLSLVQTAYDRLVLAISQGNLTSARSSLAYMFNTHGTMATQGLKDQAYTMIQLGGQAIEKAEGVPEAMKARQVETANVDANVVAAVQESNKTAKQQIADNLKYMKNAETYGAAGAELFDLEEKAEEKAKGALDAIALPSLGLGLAALGIGGAFIAWKLS